MTTPTIEINMDAKCSNCGEQAITGSGLCLDCATKALASARDDSMLDRVSEANGDYKKAIEALSYGGEPFPDDLNSLLSQNEDFG